MSKTTKVRNWCFTINNYSCVYEPLEFVPEDAFVVWQAECGEEKNTPHLQGYIEFNNQKRLGEVKKLHAKAHWEPRRGTQEQAINYASKVDDPTYVEGPWCYGEQKSQGQRNDLAGLRDMMKNGATMEEVKNENFDLYCRAKHALDEEYNLIQSKRAKAERLRNYDGVQWKEWQQEILNIVNSTPDKRKIHWYYETTGNVGKSFLTNYLLCDKNAFVVKGGRVQDIQYAYNHEPVIVLDLARTKAEQMDHLYEVMEQFKDGSFLSTKYQSVMKMFSVPHVIVFSNFYPDESKLSADRWDIHNIENYASEVNASEVKNYSYCKMFNRPSV